MTNSTMRLLFWTPRIAAILLAAFISIFALDVFGEGRGLWETVLALFIHLIPTLLVVAALVVSWRWEWIGGILFVGLGALHLYLKWGQLPWYDFVIIAGPAFIVGILFLLNWRYRTALKNTRAV
jgi:hypothetical protein